MADIVKINTAILLGEIFADCQKKVKHGGKQIKVTTRVWQCMKTEKHSWSTNQSNTSSTCHGGDKTHSTQHIAGTVGNFTLITSTTAKRHTAEAKAPDDTSKRPLYQKYYMPHGSKLLQLTLYQKYKRPNSDRVLWLKQ